MDWFNPEDISKSIITPQKLIGAEFADNRISKKVLMLLSGGDDINKLSKNFCIEEAPFLIPAFSGRRKFSLLRGESDIALIDKTLTAPIAVGMLEIIIAIGCEKLFIFGLCGAISPDLRIGDVIIPSEVLREEGVSHHYTPFGINAKPDKDMLEVLTNYLASSESYTIHISKTVTTDAVFRETITKELNWRSKGVLGVDMEVSALFTVAQYHRIPAVALLIVSDTHELDENGDWHWGGKDLEDKCEIILRKYVDFIQTIT